jgi:hypothetical protein
VSDLLAVIAAEAREDDGGDVMTTRVSTQILWDAENARMFGKLCRRMLRFCEVGQPCPLASAEGRILLVSSQRGLTSSPQRTAPRTATSSARKSRGLTRTRTWRSRTDAEGR